MHIKLYLQNDREFYNVKTKKETKHVNNSENFFEGQYSVV